MPTRTPLIRDTVLARRITAMLVVKAVILTAIWALWFSDPETDNMTLPQEKVADRMLAPAGGGM
ncbi:MAG: cytochrome oxidase putative small subunit CydP [Chromatiales bacterium]